MDRAGANPQALHQTTDPHNNANREALRRHIAAQDATADIEEPPCDRWSPTPEPERRQAREDLSLRPSGRPSTAATIYREPPPSWSLSSPHTPSVSGALTSSVSVSARSSAKRSKAATNDVLNELQEMREKHQKADFDQKREELELKRAKAAREERQEAMTQYQILSAVWRDEVKWLVDLGMTLEDAMSKAGPKPTRPE
jgi:hypothetical protein